MAEEESSTEYLVTLPNRNKDTGDGTAESSTKIIIEVQPAPDEEANSGSDEDEAEEEEQEEPSTSKSKQQLAWESLFKAAEEEFDLSESPVDTAVKTLKTGREIQKLSTIRNIAELIDGHGEEVIERVFPQIQEVLNSEPSNLDIHCESAVVFKNLVKDQKLTSKYSSLTDKLLHHILLNIENQKENVAAAAWLETLVEIAAHIPVQSVTDLIVPVAINQAESTKRVQRRVIAARLTEALCPIVPAECVRKDLAPCTQMLCQDPSPSVRTTIAQRLSIIAQSLNNPSDCVSLLLPCLIELCKDNDAGVREAILNTVAVCLPYLTKDSCKTVIVPLLRKCTEQALILRDVSLSVVAKQLGQWLQSLHECLSAQETKWFLDAYCRIAEMSMNTDGKDSTLLCTSCRRMCAYNLPCFAMAYGKDLFAERLLPILEKFCTDADDEVRCTVASGFHEILQMQPDEPALIMPFIELIRSGSAEVVQHLCGNLHKSLPALYNSVKTSNEKGDSKITRLQLDRIVIGCNRLIRGTGSWRSHEAYLNNIAVVRYLVPTHDLYLSFMPVLKQELLTVRALPCRVAAAQTLLLLMREFPTQKRRLTIIELFTDILDVVPFVLHRFSRKFFLETFLEPVLKLAKDPVSNIRLQACRLFSKIKQYIALPDNEDTLSKMENVVKDLLSTEENSYSRALIQQYACELSRAETENRDARANKAKMAEEQRLWTEDEIEAPTELPETAPAESDPLVGVVEPQKKKMVVRRTNSGTSIKKITKESKEEPPLASAKATTTAKATSPPTAKKDPEPKVNGDSHSQSPSPVGTPTQDKPPSPWKTLRPEKPKMAIVRPQPQVTVTQRSPSPMPPKAEERKSKLPLSTVQIVSRRLLISRFSPLPIADTNLAIVIRGIVAEHV
ncbi:HEAT repeat family protein [Aphelenchoides avenae]|nr:HEAT repeat family protein [Aphelenchus avenae]